MLALVSLGSPSLLNQEKHLSGADRITTPIIQIRKLRPQKEFDSPSTTQGIGRPLILKPVPAPGYQPLATWPLIHWGGPNHVTSRSFPGGLHSLSPHLYLAYRLLVLLVSRLEEGFRLMDQVAQVFLLLRKQNKGDNLSGRWGLRKKNRNTGRSKEGAQRSAPPGPRAAGAWAHLARQVDGRVAVGEVLPQQQRVFVLFPRQAVTVVVEVKRLPPVGATWEGMTEQEPGSRGRDLASPTL